MTEAEPLQILRRSPGRLRLRAPELNEEGDAGLARVAAAEGILNLHLSERTGNLLLEFDRSLIDEPAVLAVIAGGPGRRNRGQRSRRARAETELVEREGWHRAERAETIRARPAVCVSALTDFEHYPEWQTYLTAVTVMQRDERGRGIHVMTQAQVGEREIQFTTRYRYPSPHRVFFEQIESELAGVRGGWAFRSSGGGRTRVTLTVGIKPGWRLSLLFQGPQYEQIREAVLDHFMSELRERVEQESG